MESHKNVQETANINSDIVWNEIHKNRSRDGSKILINNNQRSNLINFPVSFIHLISKWKFSGISSIGHITTGYTHHYWPTRDAGLQS